LFPPDDERLSLETCRGRKINTLKKVKKKCVKLVVNPELFDGVGTAAINSIFDKGILWQPLNWRYVNRQSALCGTENNS
jgi:hypothetical protein